MLDSAKLLILKALGRSTLDDALIDELCEKLRGCSEINRCHWKVWDSQLDGMPPEEVVLILRDLHERNDDCSGVVVLWLHRFGCSVTFIA